jgi:phage terminase large subunit
MANKLNVSEKQNMALDALHWSSPKTHVLYGGAAGGGKTYLGCYWQIMRRLIYPNTKGLIMRSELILIRQTTLVTFWEVCAKLGLREGIDYQYNAQDHFITFHNKSVIIFKALIHIPSDPDYGYLGGFEAADAFIDEAQQCPKRGLELLGSRLRKNLINGIPKILMCCNPSAGYLKEEFYLPDKHGKLADYRVYIPALLRDNTEMNDRDVYEKTLLTLSENSPDILFEVEAMNQMFVSSMDASGEGFITCDPAALGNDRTIICLWKGLHLVKFYEYTQKYPHEVADIIRQLASENGVRLSNVVVDSDGPGIGVAGLLRCKEFNNGSSAVDKEHYSNLKSECFFKLSEYVKLNKVFIHDHSKRSDVIKELDLIRDRTKEDKKRAVSPKDEVKERLGRSPDYADCLMMRMYFESTKGSGKYHYI